MNLNPFKIKKREPGKHAKKFTKPTRTVSNPSGSSMEALMGRMLRGEVVAGNGRQPLPAGDYSRHPDLKQSLIIVANSRNSFDQLPSKIRALFDNDPNKLNTFMLSDKPDDISKSQELGLRQKPKAKAAPVPTPAELAATAAAAQAALKKSPPPAE